MTSRNHNNSVYDPLQRFRPILIGLGIVLVYIIMCVLKLTELVEVKWNSLLISGIASMFVFSGVAWLFYKGNKYWDRFDKEFVHIPLSTFMVLIGYWLAIMPETREATMLAWFGLYPAIHGRVVLWHYLSYSGALVAFYLFVCSQNWIPGEAQPFTMNVTFAFGSFALSIYLGLNSYFERIRDQEYIDAEEKLAEARNQLRKMSESDHLTGLLNRRGLTARLREHYTTIGVMLMDVDYFKRFNDEYGHLEGDQCLKRTANQLKSVIDGYGNAYLSRYGGEEFLVLIYDVSAEEFRNLAVQLVKSIETMKIPNVQSAVKPTVTISLGGYFSQVQAFSLYQLSAKADDLLYKAKEQGRNQYVISIEDAIFSLSSTYQERVAEDVS